LSGAFGHATVDLFMSRAEDLPGYRRRIRVEPRDDLVIAMLEDDIHAMAVTLRHDGEHVTEVEPFVHRAPWNVCPGAQAQLVRTFEGAALADVTAQREKWINCTHLHDLAVLAAGHAGDTQGLTYDVLVSDAIASERILEIRRDGRTVLEWTERDNVLVSPESVAGRSLRGLKDWIRTLDGAEREAARLLQWASMVARGRGIAHEEQSDPRTLPLTCYTFQPDRIVHAVRIRKTHDFSAGSRVPLAEFGDKLIARTN
jgi:hypothetical protein